VNKGTTQAGNKATDSGRRAEQAALEMLETRGLVLIARNYGCKLGEIDLIMRDGDTVVFVEVRYRKSIYFGSPAESIGFKKRQKIVATAKYWLQTRGRSNRQPCRFDVVTVTKDTNNKPHWISNAFTAC
jgi:putative endonuclease